MEIGSDFFFLANVSDCVIAEVLGTMATLEYESNILYSHGPHLEMQPCELNKFKPWSQSKEGLESNVILCIISNLIKC